MSDITKKIEGIYSFEKKTPEDQSKVVAKETEKPDIDDCKEVKVPEKYEPSESKAAKPKRKSKSVLGNDSAYPNQSVQGNTTTIAESNLRIEQDMFSIARAESSRSGHRISSTIWENLCYDPKGNRSEQEKEIKQTISHEDINREKFRYYTGRRMVSDNPKDILPVEKINLQGFRNLHPIQPENEGYTGWDSRTGHQMLEQYIVSDDKILLEKGNVIYNILK
jgi:hypothetical protein